MQAHGGDVGTEPSLDADSTKGPRINPRARMSDRKTVLLRVDAAVYEALARWAADELRSTNAQMEYLLRRALADVGRLPVEARPMRHRGRPPRSAA